MSLRNTWRMRITFKHSMTRFQPTSYNSRRKRWYNTSVNSCYTRLRLITSVRNGRTRERIFCPVSTFQRISKSMISSTSKRRPIKSSSYCRRSFKLITMMYLHLLNLSLSMWERVRDSIVWLVTKSKMKIQNIWFHLEKSTSSLMSSLKCLLTNFFLLILGLKFCTCRHNSLTLIVKIKSTWSLKMNISKKERWHLKTLKSAWEVVWMTSKSWTLSYLSLLWQTVSRLVRCSEILELPM